jgi:hypothetical protein
VTTSGRLLVSLSHHVAGNAAVKIHLKEKWMPKYGEVAPVARKTPTGAHGLSTPAESNPCAVDFPVPNPQLKETKKFNDFPANFSG